jgi:hypothetical protein
MDYLYSAIVILMPSVQDGSWIKRVMRDDASQLTLKVQEDLFSTAGRKEVEMRIKKEG